MSGSRKTQTDNPRAQTWLRPAQVDDLREAALTTGADYLQDRNDLIIATLYHLGLRVAELVALDVEDFELDARELYLPSHKQKGYPSNNHSPPPRTLDLSRDYTLDLRRYLNNRWKDTDAVFPSRQRDRIGTEAVRSVVSTLAHEANVEPRLEQGGRGDPDDVTPHTLRHSVAYRMLREEDARLIEVRDRLRHSSIQTTEQIYEHF
ncbi:MAG: tyrosine-type recombinase/integrase [Halobacteriales archaeon]